MYAPNFTKLYSDGEEIGTGWRPRYMDRRDFSEQSPEMKPYLDRLKMPLGNVGELPSAVNKSEFYPSIKSQGKLGSCVGNAGSYITEYFQKKAFGTSIPGSRLFLYKVLRNLQRETGDTGGYLRTGMATLALFGIPPESYYPYVIADFDKEPSQFIYSMADNYEATCYFCHDPIQENLSGSVVLAKVKKYIHAGIPSMFGFYICPSYKSGGNITASGVHPNEGYIPFPGSTEKIEGGHAVAVAGYDDNIRIKNLATGYVTMGALMFINSWGKDWGLSGYGWLPYAYVEVGLACDFWSIISMRWLDTDKFGLDEL